jgi:hypothetical protein
MSISEDQVIRRACVAAMASAIASEDTVKETRKSTLPREQKIADLSAVRSAMDHWITELEKLVSDRCGVSLPSLFKTFRGEESILPPNQIPPLLFALAGVQRAKAHAVDALNVLEGPIQGLRKSQPDKGQGNQPRHKRSPGQSP